ncbi:MAG TPA: hypothetical protein VG455_01375 [Acidimicrobiales bacterium]|nr:hypothetical protein [Acidimicrobiales bacterium]
MAARTSTKESMRSIGVREAKESTATVSEPTTTGKANADRIPRPAAPRRATASS